MRENTAYFSFRLPQPPRCVTRRQREVWRLLALGASYKEIAATLGIRPDGVKAHVLALHSRLAVTTQHEIAVLGVAAGLVTQEEQLAVIEQRTCGAVLRARSIAGAAREDAG